MRPLEPDSASSPSLDFVDSWLRKCTTEHHAGRCSEESTVLPTRVLDIGSDGDIIKLVDGTDLTGRYACLSYCVGYHSNKVKCNWMLKDDIEHLVGRISALPHLSQQHGSPTLRNQHP